MTHRVESLGEVPGGGRVELLGGSNARLGPADPLRHRRLRDEEPGRDLRSGEPGDGAEHERHLRGVAQGGMRAEHEHLERVVAVGVGLPFGGGRGEPAVRRRVRRVVHLAAGSRLTAPQLVDQPAGRHPDQPRPWIVGDAIGRPLSRSRHERLLHRVLARREVAAATQQGSEDVWRVLPPRVLAAEVGHWSSPPGHIAGRSSTVSPGPLNLAATASARSTRRDVDHEEPGELLLRLGVRAVGGDGGAGAASGRASPTPGRRVPRRRRVRRAPPSPPSPPRTRRSTGRAARLGAPGARRGSRWWGGPTAAGSSG